jgi:hypothetical protein
VRQVLDAGLDSILVQRLSTTAASQREQLLQDIAATSLSARPDKRSLPLCARAEGGLETSALYKLCTLGGETSAHANFVWQSFAPSKVKVFAWLLVRGRIQCRSNLFRKGILDATSSGCPICSAPLETPSHIRFGCEFARCFWSSMGAAVDAEFHVSSSGDYALPAAVPDSTSNRNEVVFQGLPPSLSRLRKNCRDDAVLWRARLPMAQRCDVDLWLTFFLPERP